jgi:hypothetical protein
MVCSRYLSLRYGYVGNVVHMNYSVLDTYHQSSSSLPTAQRRQIMRRTANDITIVINLVTRYICNNRTERLSLQPAPTLLRNEQSRHGPVFEHPCYRAPTKYNRPRWLGRDLSQHRSLLPDFKNPTGQVEQVNSYLFSPFLKRSSLSFSRWRTFSLICSGGESSMRSLSLLRPVHLGRPSGTSMQRWP